METALSLEAVSFRYGEAPVLDRVSLELSPGSFLGLLGPNGSGKTTLLRIAAGLLKPTGGAVRLGGRPMEGMNRTRIARCLALLPQNPGLPPTFSVWELVLMGRTPFLGFLGREGPADLAMAERAMEQARCRHLANRRLEELSGGERQRVMVARALAQQPEVLLLDEPTAHLDLQHQVAVVELVAELVDSGLAVLGVFHDLNLAASYCDRVAVLSRGRLVSAGTPAEVLTPDTLSEVFRVPLRLTPHPDGGLAVLLPAGRRGKGGEREWSGRGEGAGAPEARRGSLSQTGRP